MKIHLFAIALLCCSTPALAGPDEDSKEPTFDFFRASSSGQCGVAPTAGTSLSLALTCSKIGTYNGCRAQAQAGCRWIPASATFSISPNEAAAQSANGI